MLGLFAVALFAIAAFAAPAGATLIPFIATLDGQQEVDLNGNLGAGDLDGAGVAAVIIDDVTLTATWAIAVTGIDPIAAAHIHNAGAGANGPVVVDFDAALLGSVQDADLAAVLANPSQFYVNVHSSAFPAGAVRGQLALAVPEPGSLALLGLGVLGLAGRRAARR